MFLVGMMLLAELARKEGLFDWLAAVLASGPINLITGSLATILWLAALRREGQELSAWKFLRMGLVCRRGCDLSSWQL